MVAVVVLLLAACRGAEPGPSPAILFLSDFGTRDGAVAACKGVMLAIAPAVRVVDLTHDVPVYDVEAAGEVLEQALPYYPTGTVAVAVVDPGVGSERRAIAVRTRSGHYLVGPDNGLFTLVMQTAGVDQAVELRNTRYFRAAESSHTFHGRDLFAPVAAHLAAGVPLDSLGPAVEPVRRPIRAPYYTAGAVRGRVRYVEDPYGNVVTDIGTALLDSLGARVGDTLVVSIGARMHRLHWRRTFGEVPVGQPLALMHSRALLSFSINQGDFAARYGVSRGDSVSVRRARGPL